MVQCKKQLEDMGFIEISKDLWMKPMGNGTQIYRDYRNGEKKSYAYNKKKNLPAELFKELIAIEKIEKYMEGNIEAYC